MADDPAVVAGGGDRGVDLAGDEGARSGDADSLRPVPGGRRLDRVHVGRAAHWRVSAVRRHLICGNLIVCERPWKRFPPIVAMAALPTPPYALGRGPVTTNSWLAHC